MLKNLFSKKNNTREVKLSYSLPDMVCDIEISRDIDNNDYLANYLYKIGYKKKEVKSILEKDNPFDYVWKIYDMPNLKVESYNMHLLEECDRKIKQLKLLIIEDKIDYHITSECFWYFMFYIQSKLRYDMKLNTIDMREYEYFVSGLSSNADYILSYCDIDIINIIGIYSKQNNKTLPECFKLIYDNLDINKDYFSSFINKIGGEKFLEIIMGKIIELLIKNNSLNTDNILIK